MPVSHTDPFALRLEMLEDRMLLSGDTDWLHTAVTSVGVDFTADLIWGKDHTTARLVLHGTDSHTGSLVVDTNHLDATVTQIMVSSFDQVTITGTGVLSDAAVIDVGHLIINAPLRNNLQTTNVASIEFQTTHLPFAIDVKDGDWVQIKAPEFAGVYVFSEHTQVLDLTSSKADDTVNVFCINLGDNPVIRTTLRPENCFTHGIGSGVGSVLFYPNGIQNGSVPLHNAIVGAVPFDQVYKVLADLLARAGIDSADSILSAFTKAASAPLPAARAAEQHMLTMDHPFEVTPDAPINYSHLPAVFSTDLLPLVHPAFDVTADHGSGHAPMADTHDASLVLSPVVQDLPVLAARAATATSMTASLATPPGWITATMFEPIRGLRNFVMQRITQEFTPGERAALLEEPRASKPTVKEDRESGQ